MMWWRLRLFILTVLASLVSFTASADEVVIRGSDGQATVLYRESYALVVGAARYEHDSWNDLPRVPQEVREVETELERQGFEVETVLDPSGDELRNAIHRFVVKHGFTNANADNRFLIFFSGHGHTRPVDRGYLVPVDAPDPFLDEAGFLDKALDMVDVMAWARKIEAKHVLFVFDSCSPVRCLRPGHSPDRVRLTSRQARRNPYDSSSLRVMPARRCRLKAFSPRYSSKPWKARLIQTTMITSPGSSWACT